MNNNNNSSNGNKFNSNSLNSTPMSINSVNLFHTPGSNGGHGNGGSSGTIGGGGGGGAGAGGTGINSIAASHNSDGILMSKTKSFDQFTVADIAFKRAEQLVIYLKCLQLLKPILSYAKEEVQANKLKSTQKVRKIMRQLNNMYKLCLFQCKQLNRLEQLRNKWNSEKINLNADRLLYIHAIELCREAMMEEFFGKPQKVSFLNIFQLKKKTESFLTLLNDTYIFLFSKIKKNSV